MTTSTDATRQKNIGYSAEEYSELVAFEGAWRDSWWNQDYLELIAKRWRLAEVKTALDVGCGAGHWGQRLAALLPADARVVGVDHEAGFLDAARKRTADLGLAGRCDYREARVENLPFADDSFDLVTCQTVLIHVADPDVALGEMVRVTRPGGLIAAAEPNNRVNALINQSSEPRPAFEDTVRLLRLDHHCHLGKIALGQGDSSVGERLPGIFARAGLADLQVFQNDRCPALYPPYDARDQRLDLAQILKWFRAGVSGWGPRARTHELYLAGGGAPPAFDELWALTMAAQQAFENDLAAGRLVGGRGFLHYLVSGRK